MGLYPKHHIGWTKCARGAAFEAKKDLGLYRGRDYIGLYRDYIELYRDCIGLYKDYIGLYRGQG